MVADRLGDEDHRRHPDPTANQQWATPFRVEGKRGPDGADQAEGLPGLLLCERSGAATELFVEQLDGALCRVGAHDGDWATQGKLWAALNMNKASWQCFLGNLRRFESQNVLCTIQMVMVENGGLFLEQGISIRVLHR